METTFKDFNEKKEDRYIRASLIRTLDNIYELYPDISVAQHLSNILRSKGELDGNPRKGGGLISPYKWSNEKFQKRAEEYLRELQDSYVGNGEWDEDYEYKPKLK